MGNNCQQKREMDRRRVLLVKYVSNRTHKRALVQRIRLPKGKTTFNGAEYQSK